jgi:hypothetical protein
MLKFLKLIYLPLLILVIIVLTYSVFSSIRPFSKLPKIKFSEKKDIYGHLFHEDTSLVASFVYLNSEKVAPMQSYLFKKHTDILVFPVRILAQNEENVHWHNWLVF